MTTEAFVPRHLGNHLLVAQLGEDALGSVYRALDASEERRFDRLRVLQSPELTPEAVIATIQKNAPRVIGLFHQTIVRRTQMGVIDETPFVAWRETAGWTLDAMLAKVRATGSPIPIEFGLLIGERIAAALEHAWFFVLDSEPTHHGLLWPGFVSISNDAEVRLGGFGLAEAVLPDIHKPRLLRDIAPYIAPEARVLGEVGSTSDVYSFGVVLLELLTCRRPSLTAPFSELRAADPFSRETGEFLSRCFADPTERFSSVVEMRRALTSLLGASSYSLSSAGFALYLYQLLNPESHSVPATDGESTNPVGLEPPPARTIFSETPLTDELPDASSIEAASALLTDSRDEETTADDRRARTERHRLRLYPFWQPFPPERPRLTGAIAAVMAAVGITFGVFFLMAKLQSTAKPPVPWVAGISTVRPPIARAVGEPERPPPESLGHTSISPVSLATSEPASRSSEMARDQASMGSAPRGAHPDTRRIAPGARRRNLLDRRLPALQPAKRTLTSPPPLPLSITRNSAEDSRFQAAIARITAERLDALEIANEPFSQGNGREREGVRLLREGKYLEARAEFEVAATLFRQAENLSRDERIRRVKLVGEK